MAASIMVLLDGTIVNVAMPHMQSSVSASQEQIIWVYTSFLVATAIGTPLSGWLANRFGRKRVVLFSVASFTLASAACGLATDLYSLVLFRVLQGLGGASISPLGQATVLDIYPREKYGQAMGIMSACTLLAPLLGPTVGGLITDTLSWRWIFFINVPLGIVTLFGISTFVPELRSATRTRFDFVGFGAIAIAVASLQLMVDRGQELDWFSSPEICIEAGAAVVFTYITVVHLCTAKQPFIHLAIFADRNFVAGSLITLVLGLFLYAGATQIVPMLENLLGYPVWLTGLTTAPRGVGGICSSFITGFLVGRVKTPTLATIGMGLYTISSFLMAHLSLQTDSTPIVLAGFLQGLGTGLCFVPIMASCFSTLAPQYRNEASAMNTLLRNCGGAIGVSALQALTIRNAAIVQSRLTESVRPDNPLLTLRAPDFDFDTPSAVASMVGQITRQAWMVAYNDTFWLLGMMSIAVWPCVFLLRQAKKQAPSEPEPALLD
jgi:DHA2 family multidrug resistance protein